MKSLLSSFTKLTLVPHTPIALTRISSRASMAAMAALLVGLCVPASAQDLSAPRAGTLIVPASSIERPEDAGVRAHTNYELFVPSGMKLSPNQPGPPPGVETPASLACIYQLVQEPSNVLPGCQKSDPNLVNPSGGSGIIVIVDAFDYPNALHDLQQFSQFYSLPAPKFYKVYANGTSTPPPTNADWEGEEALDIEWAHALAPNATIILVEAQSNLFTDLMAAEKVATSYFPGTIFFCDPLIGCPLSGPGEISNSWGGAEFSSETSFDSYFEPPPIHCYEFLCSGGFDGLTIFVASGDHLQVEWPSVSPWVVSAGGTTINRDSSGKFVKEGTWYDPGCPLKDGPPCGGGGGPSAGLEPIPYWQTPLNNVLNGWRGTPDISFEANPASGVGIYLTDSNYGYLGWIPAYIGGTSLSSPALAAIANSAGNFYGYGAPGQGYIPENSLLYGEYGGGITYAAYFNDIHPGKPGTSQCGASGQYSTQYGWDFCTGVGTPRTLMGK